MPQGYRGRGLPRNTWIRDLERRLWTASFRFQLEEDGDSRTELSGDEWSVACVAVGATRHK